MDLIKSFGVRTFNDTVMRQRLPNNAYQSLKKTQRLGQPLDPSIADVVASAMKDWAVSLGATHFAHWFQPLSGVAAGKHEAFIVPIGGGRIMLDFSSKELLQAESDASSFPSGGLRSVFEARGYTAWDPTSPAFVRDGTLFIPTVFCAYTGDALDLKTPLLRSMDAVNEQGLRLLRALGNTTAQRVYPALGNEQEYFLVDRERYEERLDLKLCGRTLFGAKPPKDQDSEDHYCGRLRIRVGEFMRDLDEQLWELGIAAKTKHNERAPAQHELAVVYDIANVSCDHNQLVMEVMRTTAKRHGLACLLHEKPFSYINGSGKHHNYSLVTDEGENLLSPGKDPVGNLPFQLIVSAFVKGVDEYSDLMRLATAVVGNDERLGGYEAPPAIISVFLGEVITNAMLATAAGQNGCTGTRQFLPNSISAIPDVLRDDADRNRTSPFAFTGNKFEFRMVGSTQSPAIANTILNTILAKELGEFADRLEGAEDTDKAMAEIIRDTMQHHSRIIFNGNNYSREWQEEAARRGLSAAPTALAASHAYTDPKSVELFTRFHVLTPSECAARQEVIVENVERVLTTEAAVMGEMVSRQILPAVVSYLGKTADSLQKLRAVGLDNAELTECLQELSNAVTDIRRAQKTVADAAHQAEALAAPLEKARFMVDVVRPSMRALRAVCDHAETLTDKEYWPIPTYTDLMHRV